MRKKNNKPVIEVITSNFQNWFMKSRFIDLPEKVNKLEGRVEALEKKLIKGVK